MRVNKEINNKTKKRIRRLLAFLCTFIIVYAIEISVVAPQKYDYSVGDIASNDIKAPRDTIDEDATKEKIEEAISKVADKYTVKAEVQEEAEKNIADLFTKLNSLSGMNITPNEKVNKLKEFNNNLSNNDCESLISIPQGDLEQIEKSILSILKDIYNKNIQDGDEDALKKAKETASAAIDKLNINKSYLETIKDIVLIEIKPNLFYDKESTEALIDQIKKDTENVVIKKNQIIVNEGEPITEGQIKILKSLGLLNDENSGMTIVYITLALFIGIILYIENWYIYRNYKDIYYDTKKLILINLITIISLVLSRGFSILSPYLIPAACAPLLMSLLINYKISLFVNTMNVFLVANIVEFEPQIILICVLCSLLGSTFIRKMEQRNDILYATVFMTVVGVLLNLANGIYLSSNFKEILLNTSLIVLGMIFSGVFAIGILPFLEGIFDVVTTLKLLELSNPNSPIMKKLLMEAPGTYHHSMLVANLAEMAAEEVGANSVITRIGAYYHDIGKIARPYFFKENQLTKDNPHDKISANLSTLIIVSHVKDGVELAKEYNLPKVIVDIIKEHHGTTLVKYFYYKVKNAAENPDDIKEEDYMYPGPIPSTKEAGIIMLADSTEAAVRSIANPSSEKIQKMVHDIVDDKVKSGQLDNCNLTLRDLNKIKECFLKALNGIYHKRIEYPKEK